VQEIEEMKRQGMSIAGIAGLLGYDRKTVRKYLLKGAGIPRYGPRPGRAGKLDAFVVYLQERLQAGVWNARVLLREIRERGYTGGYSLLTDWLRPQREATRVVAVRRFETPAGKQAQVDWGHLGSIEVKGQSRKLWGLVFTLGYSRAMVAAATTCTKLSELLRLHEEAFQALGGVPEEILYDRMKTVWKEVDERGEIVWNPVFLDFARYWGFTPRLCKPYRAQTKGKVESGVKYVRRNFLCGLQGREPENLEALNAELRQWVWTVANRRVHGTTQELVDVRWERERGELTAVGKRAPYPFGGDLLRVVSRDAMVSWEGSRYSVPWSYAGKQVWIREQDGEVRVQHGSECIARHERAPRRHMLVRVSEHHAGIPLGARANTKTLVHLVEGAPMVESRSLAAYESLANTPAGFPGGGQ
jgi:transposase